MTTQWPYRVLVVEDDRPLNRMLTEHIGRMTREVRGVLSRGQALATLGSFEPDLAILDVRLPDTDELEFLPELREHCPVLVITSHGSIDQAVRAVRAGAWDYLTKPVSLSRLEMVLQRFFQMLELRRDLAFWQTQARTLEPPSIIGDSPATRDLRRLVSLFAHADTPVLILGEPGTGKETIAQGIHGMSSRANGRFVPIDCGAEMDPIQLFGSLPSSGTGEAIIAAADAGTIYLAGIDRLTYDLQRRLLRIIETATFRSRPGAATRTATVRFILSSNLRLEALAREAEGNELLHYLMPFVLEIAPLRERRADIADLAHHHLQHRAFQRSIDKSFTPQALRALESYEWPGNIRELKNVIERALIMSQGELEIDVRHLHVPVAKSASEPKGAIALQFETAPRLDEMRDAYVAQLLTLHKGNRRKVAGILGISERNLYRLLKRPADPTAP